MTLARTLSDGVVPVAVVHTTLVIVSVETPAKLSSHCTNFITRLGFCLRTESEPEK